MKLRRPKYIKGASFCCSLVLALGFVACSVGLDNKHWRLAEDAFRQGQYRMAIEEYTRVVNFGGRSVLAVQAQFQIAEIYDEQLKNYPLAIRAYRDAVKRSDDKALKIRSRWAIAKVYVDKLEKPGIAAEEYEGLYTELAQYERQGPEILLAWAKALMDAGQFSLAAKKYAEFRRVYSGHRDGPRSLLEEGQAHMADRRFDLAKENFREVIEKFSNNAEYTGLVGEAYYGLGGALEANQEYPAALESFKQSLALYPNKKVIELKIEGVMKRKKEKQL